MATTILRLQEALEKRTELAFRKELNEHLLPIMQHLAVSGRMNLTLNDQTFSCYGHVLTDAIIEHIVKERLPARISREVENLLKSFDAVQELLDNQSS